MYRRRWARPKLWAAGEPKPCSGAGVPAFPWPPPANVPAPSRSRSRRRAPACSRRGRRSLGSDVGRRRGREGNRDRQDQEHAEAQLPDTGGEQRPRRQGCQAMGRVTGFQTIRRRPPQPVQGPQAGHDRRLERRRLEAEQEGAQLLRRGALEERPAERPALDPEAEGQGQVQARQAEPGRPARVGARQPAVFTLTDPLRVRKGMIVALTTPTWISNLADYQAQQLGRVASEPRSGPVRRRAGRRAGSARAQPAAAEGRRPAPLRLHLRGRPAPVLGVPRLVVRTTHPQVRSSHSQAAGFCSQNSLEGLGRARRRAAAGVVGSADSPSPVPGSGPPPS